VLTWESTDGKNLVRLSTRASDAATPAAVNTGGSWLYTADLPARFKLSVSGDTWTASLDDDENGTYETSLGTADLANVTEYGFVVYKGLSGTGDVEAVIDAP
jgi:hypothetical protein